jgi:hypothetical protein
MGAGRKEGPARTGAVAKIAGMNVVMIMITIDIIKFNSMVNALETTERMRKLGHANRTQD